MNSIQKNQQKKLTFIKRAKSAIFIVAFLIVYLLLLVFSDPSIFSWINDNVRCALGFICVITLIPIVFFSSKEISNLCFPKNKAVFFYTLISLFVLLMFTSIFLLGCRYLGWWDEHTNGLDQFAWHLIICLSGIVFFTFVSTLVWIVMSRHIQYVGKKTKIWYPILMFLMNLFFVGFIYSTIIHGWSVYVFLLISCVCCDTFAYIGGSLFGKHHFAAKISPNKTWEGLVFGMLITLLILCGFTGLFFINGVEETTHGLYSFLGNQCCSMFKNGKLINLQPYYWAIYIFVFVVLMSVSVCGDLFFSFIKRKFNIKDFSNLIPGHGGMLDRIDSIIFVFVFYFLITVIIQISMYMIPGQQSGLIFLWTKGL